MNWNKRNVLITGGASFIGSTLVDALLARGANIRVVDDVTSGKLENLKDAMKTGRVEFIEGDLRDQRVTKKAVDGMNVGFHLAADHGGRGCVALRQAARSANLVLDAQVLRKCLKAKVDKVVYASSGCVFPNYIQIDPNAVLYLTEARVGPPYDGDNMYDWAKLMAEMTPSLLQRLGHEVRVMPLFHFTQSSRR
jgi:nucleoside-diphosphate-sugar epimerase